MMVSPDAQPVSGRLQRWLHSEPSAGSYARFRALLAAAGIGLALLATWLLALLFNVPNVLVERRWPLWWVCAFCGVVISLSMLGIVTDPAVRRRTRLRASRTDVDIAYTMSVSDTSGDGREKIAPVDEAPPPDSADALSAVRERRRLDHGVSES